MAISRPLPGPASVERRNTASRTNVSSALALCREQISAEIVASFRLANVRKSVATFTAVARLQQMPPERVLACFKEMLSTIPELQRKPAEARLEILGVLSKVAIDAYYDVHEP